MRSEVDEEQVENVSSTSCRSMFIKVEECFGRVIDTCLIPRFSWFSGRHRNDSTTYSRGSMATVGRNAVGDFERGGDGLDREDVALLPPTSPGMDFAPGKRSAEICTRYMNKKGIIDEYDATCPTCLEEYDVENPKCWTRCGHHFHVPCIYEWLERSQVCPVCSRKVDPDSLTIDSDLA